MIEKIKTATIWGWQHPVTALLLLVLVALFFYFTWTSVRNLKTALEDRAFDKHDAQRIEAGQQLQEKVVTPAVQDATEAAGARRVLDQEYERRAPERTRRKAAADAARVATEAQERKYEETRNNFQPGTGPLDLRERRAVAAARALYR